MRLTMDYFQLTLLFVFIKDLDLIRKAFEKAGRDIEAARKRGIINKFKWVNNT